MKTFETKKIELKVFAGDRCQESVGQSVGQAGGQMLLHPQLWYFFLM